MHPHDDGPERPLLASSADSTEPTILWAEDNAQDRAFIQESLDRAANPGVTLVPDGVVLMHALGQWRPDLVVLDLKMPRLGGMEALGQIRAHPDLKALPVIIFSSGERPDEIAQCHALGVVEVVVKPLDFDLFSAEVQRIARLAAGDHARRAGASPGAAMGEAKASIGGNAVDA